MRFRVVPFYLATHGLTWLFLVPFALLQWSIHDFPRNILFFLGGLGPLVATFLFVRATRDRAYIRDYWHRILSFRRFSAAWWLVILLLP